MNEPQSTSYDQVPYPAGAYPQSHPDRLEVLARLFGMSPQDVRHCRVLELGCADGSNLIPMACALEESEFLGVDLSQRQIAAGHEAISALGLTNVELRHTDIRDVHESFGAFDYIIAHGVYSWVPTEVQNHLLRICRERLSPQGVAYVSYNTYPGWRMRGMLRDMMLYHSRKFDNPDQQVEQARALIQWLAETVRAESSAYGMLLRTELEQMQSWQDTYFRHDSLEEVNEPIYFHQFVERSGKQGLQYLAEAEFPTMLAGNYAAAVNETLNRLGRDIIEMEQYLDFVRNRMFRQTLLCHNSVKLKRALGPWSLKGMWLAACLRPGGAEVDFAPGRSAEFSAANGLRISSAEPIVKAAVICLGRVWPGCIAHDNLRAEAEALLVSKGVNPGAGRTSESVQETLDGALLTFVCKGLCELHGRAPDFVVVTGRLPQACPLARWQARRGSQVINRRHERVTLDSFARHLLPLLDGKREQAAIVESLVELVTKGTLSVAVNEQPLRDPEQIRKIMERELEKALHRFGHAALLVG